MGKKTEGINTEYHKQGNKNKNKIKIKIKNLCTYLRVQANRQNPISRVY
jgi:hypothetical protein